MLREPRLLPDVLRERAERLPAKQAYVFLDEHGDEAAALTYGELHARALAVAGELGRRCRPGDRALLLFPPGLDFVVAFFGCLYARVIAVPVNPPRRGRVHDATRSVVRDCAPAAVLTVSAMLAAARPALDAVSTDTAWLAVDEVDVAAGAADADPQPCSPESVAFLQYTSGSTSDPKGVMVSHRNLAANEEMIRHGFGHDEHSTVVGWAPLFHDQGLIGNALQPLYVGASSVLMSPLVFIRRPLLWLQAISRYRAHSSGGPNFAYDVCVAQARGGVPDGLDLSSWKVAFNGAEPIRPETLRRFARTFAPFGFDERALYPCYGLAEATLIVAGSGKGRGPRTLDVDVDELGRLGYRPPVERSRTLVGSGQVLPGEDVRIVDPGTRQSCEAGRIGEIWVSGDHVAQGYWRRPDAAATFEAECDVPGRRYLRTGDLGMLVDGELYVVGRIKDLIVVRGRNYYPQDIEHTTQSSHPALRLGACAAFAVTDEAGERLVVVQEVQREAALDLDDVAGAIREAIVREHEVTVGDLVLTVPGQLEKTSSGKIRRTAARNRYLDGGFEPWTPGELASEQRSRVG